MNDTVLFSKSAFDVLRGHDDSFGKQTRADAPTNPVEPTDKMVAPEEPPISARNTPGF